MIDKGCDLNLAYGGTPFILGSAQDVSGMQLAYQAAPFLVANQEPGASYTYDSRLRFANLNFTQQTVIAHNYDNAGNRTSVVTTCGPGGC